MGLRIKIIDVNHNGKEQIECCINEWLADKEFKTLEVQHIVEYAAPRIGTRVYIIYELQEAAYAGVDNEDANNEGSDEDKLNSEDSE